MAYKKEDLEKQAIKAIKDEGLVFLDEIVAFLPCSEKTFYNHKLQELQSIKELLKQNRIQKKHKMRRKWEDSDNATLQVAAYKLLADDKEFDKLTSQTNKNLNKQVDEFKGKTDKEIEEEVKALNERGQQKTD